MSDPHPAGHDEAALTEGLGSANKTTTLSLSKTKVKKPALYTTKGRSAAGDFSALWYQDWLVQTCASIGQIIQAHGEDTPTVHVDKVGRRGTPMNMPRSPPRAALWRCGRVACAGAGGAGRLREG